MPTKRDPINKFWAEVGDRMRVIRTSRGWSRDALGAEIGYTGASIMNWEMGYTRMNLEQAVMLVKVFELRDVDDIIGRYAPDHVV